MTITPGSLDYLYYNGILDHIPYEAYEMGAVGIGSTENPYRNLKAGIDSAQSQGMNNPAGMQQINSNQIMNMGQYGISNNYGTNSDGLITYPQGITGSQYMDYAMQGNAYNQYGNQDQFVRQDKVNRGSLFKRNNSSDSKDTDAQLYGEEGASLKNSIESKLTKTADRITSVPSILKGLLGVGVIAGTLILILKGKKKP